MKKVSNKKEDIGERKEKISDLAKEFNSFYTNTKILDENNPDYNYNLLLVKRFSETMKKGLELLGIETVEKK